MDDWNEQDDVLVSTVECDDFKDAIDLVNQIAVLAEEKEHHPDIMIHEYNQVTISLTTHEANAVTDKDYDMAQAIDDLL